MATATEFVITQAIPFSGGVTTIAPVEEGYEVIFTGIWAVGDNWTITLTDNLSGLQTQVGSGYVTGVNPTFTFTYNNKVYILAGSTIYMSALDSPTVWNDPNASGNGFITLTNWYSTPEPIIAAAPFEGYLAFFSSQTIQIWQTDANLANWSIQQTLTNIGTIAPQSVQALGALDVIFLALTGFRSLRSRDIVLNAFVNDLGSPIDPIVQTALLSGNGALANAVIEPTSQRYMCLLNGIIYVLSYFPSNKILAWSTYTPIDSTGGVFTPFLMQVYNGQVWIYGTDANGNQAAYQYGGGNNNTYDATKAKWQTGFLDAKTPGTIKTARAVDIVVNAGQGGISLSLPDSWSIYCSMDQRSAGNPAALADPTKANFTQVYKSKTASFDIGNCPYSDAGTHFSIYAQSNGDGNNGTGGPASFSEVLLHYEAANEKG